MHVAYRIAALALAILLVAPGDPASAGDAASSVPAAPVIQRAYPVDGGFVAEWRPAGTGSEPIRYEIATARYSSTDRSWSAWRIWPKGQTTERALFTASNATQVRLKVRAIGDSGPSAWSPTRGIVVGAPRSPINTSATSGTGTITVTWRQGDDNGSPITWQEVWYRDLRFTNSTWRQAQGGWDRLGNRWVATGLTPGRLYEFYARSWNANGWGPRGSVVKARPGT